MDATYTYVDANKKNRPLPAPASLDSYRNMKTCFQQEQRPTIAFLALGSLGDCLPLCALAAALPAYCYRQHRNGAKQSVPGTRAGIEGGKVGVGARGVGGVSTTAAVSFDRVGCVVVTHRCHCDLLEGEGPTELSWAGSILFRQGIW